MDWTGLTVLYYEVQAQRDKDKGAGQAGWMGSQESPLGCRVGSWDVILEVTSFHRENSRRKRIHGRAWDSKTSKRKTVKFGSEDSDTNGPVQFHLTVFVYVGVPFRNPWALFHIPTSSSVIVVFFFFFLNGH